MSKPDDANEKTTSADLATTSPTQWTSKIEPVGFRLSVIFSVVSLAICLINAREYATYQYPYQEWMDRAFLLGFPPIPLFYVLRWIITYRFLPLFPWK